MSTPRLGADTLLSRHSLALPCNTILLVVGVLVVSPSVQVYAGQEERTLALVLFYTEHRALSARAKVPRLIRETRSCENNGTVRRTRSHLRYVTLR